MNIKKIKRSGVAVTVVSGAGMLLTDAQSAPGLLVSVGYETGCSRIAIYSELEYLPRGCGVTALR
jgi:biotin operon repressor